MSSQNPITGNMSSTGVSKNAIVKIITIGLTTLIEIWYTQFLISSLGVELYGLLPLATNIIMFGAIINLTIVSSTGRFVAIEIHKGESESACDFYSSGCQLAFIICIGLLFLSAIISWYIPVIFKIPVGYEQSARILFASIFLLFIISFGISTMTVGTFIYNRLDLNDWLNFGKIFCSRGVAFVLITVAGYELGGISLGLISALFFTIVGGLFIHNKLTPEFRVSFNSLRTNYIHKIMTFGGWLMLRQISVRMLIFTDLFIVNYLYGATKSGLYAIAFFFPSKLRILTGPFAGLLKPIILNRYAKNDFLGMSRIACQGIRLVGVVFAYPVGVLCGLYSPIFSIWVGSQYQSLSLLAVILTCHVSLNVSCYPLFAIQEAFNKVKIPSIFSCFMAGVYCLLAFTLTDPYFGLGVTGVAIAGAISLTLNHAIFNPFYTSLLLKVSPWQFYKSFMSGIIGCTMTAVFLYMIQKNYVQYSIFKIGSLILISGIVYVLFAWCVLLSSSEREFLTKSFPGLRNRFRRNG